MSGEIASFLLSLSKFFSVRNKGIPADIFKEKKIIGMQTSCPTEVFVSMKQPMLGCSYGYQIAGDKQGGSCIFFFCFLLRKNVRT